MKWILNFNFCEVTIFGVPYSFVSKEQVEFHKWNLLKCRETQSRNKCLVDMHRGDSRIQDSRLSSVMK